MTAPPPSAPSRTRSLLPALIPLGMLVVAGAALVPGLAPEPLHASPFFDPFDVDSDGIPDTQEFVLGTSQFVADSDGDGYLDAEELARGTNPQEPNDFPARVGVGALRIGMTARGENGQLRLLLALYSEAGTFNTSVLRIGALANGFVVSVPFHRLLPYAEMRDVQLPNGGMVRTLDIELSPAYVHMFGATTFFVAVGAQGSLSYHSAAKVDLYSVENTLLMRREPSASQQPGGTTPTGGGSLRQPIPTTGPGGVPATWSPGQICYQRSSVTGMIGPKVLHEVVLANCLSGWDTFCPADCSASVGDTYETIDPAALIGG